MSTHPDENEIEIEEGEIISDDDEDISEVEDEDFAENGGIDIAELMTSLLATEDGDTVCSALVTIATQLQTQNKILIKMLSKMNSA
jgi:hypothetical protein|tara:strand:+ start:109 stop:366 length:258 start_codon:yes stop_codon:yes gene_type:complete